MFAATKVDSNTVESVGMNYDKIRMTSLGVGAAHVKMADLYLQTHLLQRYMIEEVPIPFLQANISLPDHELDAC